MTEPGPPAEAPALPEAPDEGRPELGYTVALDAFSGPMDLLLFLVRRAEVDVKDIPISLVADQFAEFVAGAAGTLDLEQAGDFVVMAATLLEIKARMVAPPPAGEEVPSDDDDLDPRAGLIRKLLVYRAAKEAALDLDRREDDRRLRHERGSREVVPDDPAELDAWELKDVDSGTLAKLWFGILRKIDGGGPRTVIVDDVPMGVRMAKLAEEMRLRGEGHLSELFAAEPTQVGRVAIVMAVLECARQRMVAVRQAEQYGDVALRFREESERPIVQGEPQPPEMLPKRQRRPPLVTWSGTPGAADDAGEEPAETGESPIESEEQRFLREMEGEVGLERLLGRTADLESGFITFWEERFPGQPLPPGVVKPEPPPPPPAAEPAKAEEPAKPKRQPKPKAVPEVEAAKAEPAAVPVADAAKPVEPEAAKPEIQVPVTDATKAVEPEPAKSEAVAPPQVVEVVPAQVDAAVVVESPKAIEPEVAKPAPVPESSPVPQAGVVVEPAIAQVVATDAAVPTPSAAAETMPVPLPSAAAPAAIPTVPAGPSFTVVSLPPVDAPAPIPVPAAELPSVPVPVAAIPVLLLPMPAEPAMPGPVDGGSEDPDAKGDVSPRDPEPQPPPDPGPPPGPAPADPVAAIPIITTSVPSPQPAHHEADTSDQPEDMPRLRPSTLIALVALNALALVVFFVWIQRPGDVLTVLAGPDGGATVPRSGALTWQLNLPVADTNRVPQPQLTPMVDGAWTWLDPRTVRFTPAGDLPPATAFTVAFPERLRAAGGFRQKEPHQATFRTAPPILRDLRQLHFTSEGRVEFQVVADQSLDLARLAASLHGPVPVSVAGDRLVMTVDPKLLGTRTTLELAAGAVVGSGPLGIDQVWKAEFALGHSLKATAVGAVAPAFAEPFIEVACDREPGDPSALIAALRIEPEVVFKVQPQGRHLRLIGEFTPGSSYRLMIAARWPDGHAGIDDLPAAGDFRFTIPDRQAGARVLGDPAVGRIRIQTVNLGSLSLAVARPDGVIRRQTLDLAGERNRQVETAIDAAPFLAVGANRIALTWPGGAVEQDLVVHRLPLAPAELGGALLQGSLPVVAPR